MNERVSPRVRWMNAAAGHGLALGVDDFRMVDGWWLVDGMDPDEWIVTVCGCGGKVERCAS
jgi:hypothetical protein